ncbi:LuxR C-terminal-related transcriptional regulator [Actinomadura rudentiformis]|uniref:DUF1707 domain-containing protein n=1 Tax=Actinomadura rudentiformis TaxID=359158 RepID=A0A6H9YIL6_9ACTN|nr:LuxR C-terminal-related transcriptional regulator [Actinomadura rudentiformis]KAB2345915.1 DUF1707 domain-containing protein [Actinomadura rudentiformis]
MLDDRDNRENDGDMDGNQRAGDVDRQRTVDLLQAHLTAGRLTMEEFLDRNEAAAAARTQAQLAEALRDLPDEPRPRPRDTSARDHAMVAASVSGVLIGLWQLTRDPSPAPKDYGADYWWPLWFSFFWSLAVLLHYLLASGRLSIPAWRRPADEPPAARSDPPGEQAARTAPAVALDVLTKREREILALVAEGCTNKEIARRLFISERTARTHVSSILRKLELPSRTQAALVAVRGAWPTPSIKSRDDTRTAD